MGMVTGVVLLFVATTMAIAASRVMTSEAAADRPSGWERPLCAERRAVTVLVVASLAAGAGAAGAAQLSSGDPSILGLGPFLLAVLLVLTPLFITARRARHRTARSGKPEHDTVHR